MQTSFNLARVADTSDLAIRVWINSVDRPHIETGTPVRIILDALPGFCADLEGIFTPEQMEEYRKILKELRDKAIAEYKRRSTEG